jgi:hypothetical protein
MTSSTVRRFGSWIQVSQQSGTARRHQAVRGKVPRCVDCTPMPIESLVRANPEPAHLEEGAERIGYWRFAGMHPKPRTLANEGLARPIPSNGDAE